MTEHDEEDEEAQQGQARAWPGRPRSFAGAHPYRPQCVADAIREEWALDGIDVSQRAVEIAAEVTLHIDSLICPRCREPLDPGNTAGSRVTRCRCVPVCPRCGSDEANQGILGRGMSQVWRWPVRKSDVTKRANAVAARSTPAILAGGKIITEDGVGDVTLREHPGGWIEYGYDDNPDDEDEDREGAAMLAESVFALDAARNEYPPDQAPLCDQAGCDRIGVIPNAVTTPEGTRIWHWCLIHDPEV